MLSSSWSIFNFGQFDKIALKSPYLDNFHFHQRKKLDLHPHTGVLSAGQYDLPQYLHKKVRMTSLIPTYFLAFTFGLLFLLLSQKGLITALH